jgi:hypothetical protein
MVAQCPGAARHIHDIVGLGKVRAGPTAPSDSATACGGRAYCSHAGAVRVV